MVDLVQQHMAEIRALCVRYGVLRLGVFGSATRSDFDPTRSDIDFVVEFAPGPRSGFDDKYFGLRRDLQRVLGRPVDLVEHGCVTNPLVAAEIERGKASIYAAA